MVAANVLGTIGTVLWCIQLIPQIWYNWRRKKTDGFPQLMMLLWASCAVPMGAYLILQNVNIPLQVQPQIFGVFSLISWGQILYYNQNAILSAIGLCVLFGGIEAMLILTLRIPYSKGITWPDLVVGVVAAVLLASGLIPPYFELWKRDGRVIGISELVRALLKCGEVTRLMNAAAEGSFDILGGIMYIIVVVLEGGIYVSHIVWRIRYRHVRQEAKTRGRSVDELLAERNQPGDVERGEKE
ncbi:PQ loop repeat protein [Aspergillus floccosus]